METLLNEEDDEGVRLDNYVVRLFDADKDPETGLVYIVTELIEGFNFWELITGDVNLPDDPGGPLPPKEALFLIT
ncbi:MAG: hypothetical protein KDA84_03925 [Planctomycetaceae bacterium]|nr:hypothetical protein [Planctomycetaceae bacterium]